jgi:hypothetical protein
MLLDVLMAIGVERALPAVLFPTVQEEVVREFAGNHYSRCSRIKSALINILLLHYSI